MEKLIINNDILFSKVVELLKEDKTVTIPVKGVSMLPFIKGERDSVELESLCGAGAARPVSRGDIVLFRYRGRYILHRVLDPGGPTLVIRGDGVPEGCEYPSREEVFGRVRRIFKKGKRPVDPRGKGMMAAWRIWEALRPLRRYILALYRRLVWPGFCRKQQ